MVIIFGYNGVKEGACRMAEMLDIFNEERELLGIRSREDVHKEGHWHQTFQCWFLRRLDGVNYVYWQQRHKRKADFPGLLDITAAGHLSAGETVEDGAREVEEELGIQLTLEEMHGFGCWKASYAKGAFLDNEFCHVYFYLSELPHEAFRFQDGEVSALVLMSLEDAKRLTRGEAERVTGMKIMPERKEEASIEVRLTDLVPHEAQYYEAVFGEAERLIQAMRNAPRAERCKT
jgi:isopentenyldiphosphate isomerase